ncbi:MAG: AAA family ATPase [Carboxylicivirga sp.]|jgi:DNA transposition AAA+ family ATPase|nr:AAA family ATPase [Carboxylicivirga sp.]
MNTSHKNCIVAELEALARKESQSKIARRAGVSTATISQMINQNWELIRDEMWQKVKINLHIDWAWQTAETTNLKALNQLLTAAQKRSMSIAISHNAGAGKSHTYRLYSRTFENVIYVECKNYWTKKSYARQLCTACGVSDSGTVEQLIERFIATMKSMNKALVIIDQVDKLKDSQLDLFMDFYNELDGHCGFVLSGVPALKRRIERGCQLDKIGYKELRSRIGRKYIQLANVSENDVTAVCKANGVNDEQVINEIYNTCEGDLRRVRRSIDQYFLMKEIA